MYTFLFHHLHLKSTTWTSCNSFLHLVKMKEAWFLLSAEAGALSCNSVYRPRVGSGPGGVAGAEKEGGGGGGEKVAESWHPARSCGEKKLLCAGMIFLFSSFFIRWAADLTYSIHRQMQKELKQVLLTGSFTLCLPDKWCFVTSCVTLDMQTLTMAKTLNFFPQRPRWMWKCFLHVDISLVTIFSTLVWCVVPPLCTPSCHFLFSAWNQTSPCAPLENN